MDKGKRIHVYLNETAYAVIEQLRNATGDSLSSIVTQLIIDRGVSDGIIELEENRSSLYEDRKMSYNYSTQQTRFENLLSNTRREVHEYSLNTEKDIRSLNHAINDVEKLAYQLRDMLNSMLKFSQEETEKGFYSADANMREYDPHLFAVKSEENYNKLQERYAVEKANTANKREK